MATLTRKNMAFMYLASSKGDIYSPASADGLIHNILIHNTNTSIENVVLYYHDGTNEYIIFNLDIAANDTVLFDFRGEGFYVEDAGKITGNTDTASKVTIKIDGTEEA